MPFRVIRHFMPHPSPCSGPPFRAFAASRRHRSIKLLPGLRLNFGKRGISTSIGVRGAHVTFGRTGTRTTVGLPGSGMSYSHLDRSHHGHTGSPVANAPSAPNAARGYPWRGLLWAALFIVMFFSAVFSHLAAS
jgi:hypothetical protein